MSFLSPSATDKGLFRVTRADTMEKVQPELRTQVLLIVIALVLVAIYLPRCFNGDFWFDETCTIKISEMSFDDIISMSSHGEKHPPLYYLAFAGFCNVFGHTAFVYNAFSLIMMAIMLLMCATVVYRQFGRNASIITMIFAFLLSSSFRFATEVRMYEMAMVLVFIAYLSAYCIFRYGRKIDIIIFVIASILSMLTYYYCILMIGFVTVVLLMMLFKDAKKLKTYVAVVSVIAIVGALCAGPVIKMLYGDIDKFWIERPENIFEMIEYLFHSYASVILAPMFIILIGIYFWIKKKEDDGKGLWENFITCDANTKWIVAGIVSILGTYIIVLIVSITLVPLSVPKHLYPMSAIAWLIMAFLITNIDFKGRKNQVMALLAVSLIVMVGATGYSAYEEQKNWESTQSILEKTSEIDENDVVISNDEHYCGFWGSEIPYYYPKAGTYYSPENIMPTIDGSLQYWIFEKEKVNENVRDQLESQGYKAVLFTEGMFAGDYYTYVYEIVPL